MSDYQIGDIAVLSATFTDDGDPPIYEDPTTVLFSVRAPDGTVSTPTATQTGPGVYTAEVAIDQSGLWTYKVLGTGDVQAADQKSFRVDTPFF
jgi:hypothetical protein